MTEIIKDINDLRETYEKVLKVIDYEVDEALEGYKEWASYSKSEARIVDYYHKNTMSIEKINGKPHLFYGVSETTMELNIGSNETLEGLEVTYYPSDNKNHIPFTREMLIIDALYNSREQEKSVSDYVDVINGLNGKISEFKLLLESFGAVEPVEINLLTTIPNLNKNILNDLVSYALDEKIENRLLTEEELNVFNSLYPIEFEINLNFYSSDLEKHYEFINNFFLNFMWGMDMDKYIEKNKNEQISLRNFCLSSINKEDKKREVKKKI